MKRLTEKEVLARTSKVIRCFYSRDGASVANYLADDFLWIGAYDFQYVQGKDAFLKCTQRELDSPPVTIIDEEYHLLLHAGPIWIVHGRYAIFATMDDGSVIHTHTRGTYVWRWDGTSAKLIHIHGSNAQDVPLHQIAPAPSALLTSEQSTFFDYVLHATNTSITSTPEKLNFRDISGGYRLFSSYEILYLESNGQQTKLYTKNQVYTVSGLLGTHMETMPEVFFRIHKSYAVNLLYVESLIRYETKLHNDITLPVSKERYMAFKAALFALKQRLK